MLEGVNLRGYVRDYNNRKRYIFITPKFTADQVFGHCDDMDAPGGHFCFFTRGQAVLFDVIMRNEKPRAVKIRLENPPELPDYETSIICDWGPQHYYRFGFANRECPLACRIFVDRRRILSDDEGINSLKVGSRIRHTAVKTPKGWGAHNVDVFVEASEKLNNFNVVLDPQHDAGDINVIKGSYGSKL